jgi:hypothetical protein
MRMTGYTCLLLIALGLPHTVCLADDDSHRKAAETLLMVVKTFITKHMNWSTLKDDMINLYVQAFTEDELKQLTTFYRSPLGQKAADKMPQLVEAGTQLGITRLRANREELDQMIGAEQKKPEKQQ